MEYNFRLFRYRLDEYNATYQRLSPQPYYFIFNNRPSPDTINAMFTYLNPGITLDVNNRRFYLVDVEAMAYFLSVYFYIERNTLNDEIVCRDINNNIRSLNEIVDIFFNPRPNW